MQKAYDSVNRELRWEVLTRSGVPTKRPTIISNFHEEGIRARVRTDEGDHSEWFDNTQGLQQGCVLSPLLFDVFFAPALHVRVLRSCVTRPCSSLLRYTSYYCSTLLQQNKDRVIVSDLVQLNDAGVLIVETEKQEPLARVRRALWGMFYADDAGIVSNLAEGLAKMMTVIPSVFEAAGLTVSENKTDTMFLLTPDRTDNPHPSARHRSSRVCLYGDRQPSSYTHAASSTKTPTSLSKSTDGSVCLMRACLERFGPELSDEPTAALSLKVRMMPR